MFRTIALITFSMIFLCSFGLFPVGGFVVSPMCTVIAGGCAEAWGMAEVAAPGYSGPLFQISNGSTTLDIQQLPSGKANMTTWLAFCGGSNTTSNGIVTNSVCKVSKIYAEIHGSANDLVPSVFLGSGINCTPGGNFCACSFRYEVATALPILYKEGEMCEYTLVNDQAATGINSGSNPLSLVMNGLPNLVNNQCCGSFGLTHKYNAGDTEGTDFSMITASVVFNCGMSPFQCIALDEEAAGDGGLLTVGWGSSGEPIVVVVNHDTVGNAVNGWVNGFHVFDVSPPMAPSLIPGTSIHIGGGGDLSQPADIKARELAVTNTAMTQTDVNEVLSQIKVNYSGLLTFPSIM